jgi:hypothetical protein
MKILYMYVWPQTGYGLVNRFVGHLQGVATNNHNTITDFHTTNYCTLKSSQPDFTSRYLVTALNNGHSSAMFY